MSELIDEELLAKLKANPATAPAVGGFEYAAKLAGQMGAASADVKIGFVDEDGPEVGGEFIPELIFRVKRNTR